MKFFHDLDLQGAFKLVRALIGSEPVSATGELRYDTASKRAQIHDGAAPRKLLQENDAIEARLARIPDVTDNGQDGDVLTKSGAAYVFSTPAIRKTTTQVDSAAFNQLDSSPVVLAPAPGAGKALIPLAAWFYYLPAASSPGFTIAPTVEIGYANAPDPRNPGYNAEVAYGGDYGSKTSPVLVCREASPLFVNIEFENSVSAENQAIVLSTRSQPQGNGSCRVFLWYDVIDVSLA